MTAATANAARCCNDGQLGRRGDNNGRLNRRRRHRFDFDRLRGRNGRRWRYDRLDWGRRGRGLGLQTNELQSLAVVQRTARAAVSTSAAPRWSKTARTLLSFDDRMMHRKRRHEQHNDEPVYNQREQGTRTSILTSARQRERRQIATSHKRRGR
jgi:hypothetical protein